MLTTRRRRYRALLLKGLLISTLGVMLFMPKLHALKLPELGFPFVGTAVATEPK
jgi:hypothetical protein